MTQIINQVVMDKEFFESLIQRIDKILSSFPDKSDQEEILDSKEAMRFLKCRRTTLNKLMNEEGLPYHRSGKLIFLKSELIRWLKSK